MPVVLLMDYETGFVDLSLSAHPFTAAGGATTSTAQAKFGASSALIGTTGGGANRVSQSDLSFTDWQFGAGQFTVECWVYLTAAPGSNVWGFVTQFGGVSNLGWFLGPVSGNLAFYYSTTGSDNPNVGAAWTPTLNIWYHIAADRDASNVLRVYANGVVIASATVAATFFASTQPLIIGNDNGFVRSIAGYIDEVRVTKGTAQYGGAFTPPSAPFPFGTAADIGGVVREAIVASAGEARLSGVVRETLLWSPTAVELGGLAREVLLLSPPPARGYQTAVAINTG